MSGRTATKPCFFSSGALSVPELPPYLRQLGRAVSRSAAGPFSVPVIVACASELIRNRIVMPDWSTGSSTRYLIVLDVPDAVLPRLFSVLDLRRPDQRLHLTRDTGSVRRLIISTRRSEPMLGIVDAVLWDNTLTLVTGDFQLRAFPLNRIPLVAELPDIEQELFEISADGSRLYWPSADIHLGVSQILQDADPMYLADIAIERNRQDQTGGALRSLREERGLRQSDVPGLSERQVRRIEDGISRLRVKTAEKFATAFDMDLATLLDAIARYAGQIRASAGEKTVREHGERFAKL